MVLKRILGHFLALAFALAMIVEVAGLPWISTFSLKIEKTVLVDVSEIDAESNDVLDALVLRLLPDLHDFAPKSDFLQDAIAERSLQTSNIHSLYKPPVFIQTHALRI